jgi:multicomponent Na+:H+ antiporter subunit C
MPLLYALAIAVIAACGVQLMLSRHILRTLLGITVISAAANLVIFYAGRIGAKAPPVIPDGESALSPAAANPLPQALILTAIVIGFAMTAFGAALALRTYRSFGTPD